MVCLYVRYNKRLNLKILVVLLLTLFSGIFAACQKDRIANINQDKIYIDYQLYYNEDNQITTVSVLFKKKDNNGSLLKLSSKSKISFNDDVLPYNSELSCYQKEINGKIETGTFTWIDSNGKHYVNTIALSPIEIINPDTVYKSSDYSLQWQGSSLNTGETIYFILNGKSGGVPQLLSLDGVGKNTLVITKETWSALNVGELEVIAERIKVSDPQQKTQAGGVMTAKYRAATVKAFIK